MIFLPCFCLADCARSCQTEDGGQKLKKKKTCFDRCTTLDRASEKLVEGRAAKMIGSQCYWTRTAACTVCLLGAMCFVENSRRFASDFTMDVHDLGYVSGENIKICSERTSKEAQTTYLWSKEKSTTRSSILKNSEGHAQHKGNVEIGEVVSEMSSSTAIRVMERQLPK